jgi:hypothetical protein
MEISNKTLVVLLVAAIIISVGGAMITIAQVTNLVNIIPALRGITGLGSVGRVNVSVTALAQLDVVRANIDFGVGYVATGQSFAVLNSSKATPAEWTADAGSWTAQDLQIANTGTVDINVSLTSSVTSDSMIGGTNPNLNYTAYDNETKSCWNNSLGEVALANLTQITSATAEMKVCENLSFLEATNSINMSIVLKVPQNALAGNKTAVLTFTALRRQSP